MLSPLHLPYTAWGIRGSEVFDTIVNAVFLYPSADASATRKSSAGSSSDRKAATPKPKPSTDANKSADGDGSVTPLKVCKMFLLCDDHLFRVNVSRRQLRASGELVHKVAQPRHTCTCSLHPD